MNHNFFSVFYLFIFLIEIHCFSVGKANMSEVIRDLKILFANEKKLLQVYNRLTIYGDCILTTSYHVN